MNTWILSVLPLNLLFQSCSSSPNGLYRVLQMNTIMISSYHTNECTYWNETSNMGFADCGRICNFGCCLHFTWDTTSGCMLCLFSNAFASNFVEWTGDITTQINKEVYINTPQAYYPGIAFGMTAATSSYLIYYLNHWPTFTYGISDGHYHSSHYTLVLNFRTLATEGILFFCENYPTTSSSVVTDQIAGYIKNGYVHHLINNHPGPGVAKSAAKYNDGKWHTATFVKANDNCQLCVDGVCSSAVATASGGVTSLVKQFKVGGIPSSLVTKAQNRLGVSSGFKGCISNMTVNGNPVEKPSEVYNIQDCCLAYQ